MARYEDAQLILRLYELRREEKLREAREWFSLQFFPQTAKTFLRYSRRATLTTRTFGW